MKKLLAMMPILLLAGCFADNNNLNAPPTTSGGGASGGGGETGTPEVKVSSDSTDNSLLFTWIGLPTNWTRYRLCLDDNSAPDNCDEVKSGDAGDGKTRVKLGDDISTEDGSSDKLRMRFYDDNGEMRQEFAVDIDKETVDATLTYVKAPTPFTGNRLGDLFGSGVAMNFDASTLLVSSTSAAKDLGFSDPSLRREDAGAVYVYQKNAAGWQAPQYLKHPNPGIGDLFGISSDRSQGAIAIDDKANTIIVGVPGDDSSGFGVGAASNTEGSTKNTGAVVVFNNENGRWQQKVFVKAEALSSQFGNVVAISGDGLTFAVGHNNTPQTVDVYQKKGDAWQFYTKIALRGTILQQVSSLSISEDGSVIAAGVQTNASGVVLDPSNEDSRLSGATYVFSKNGLGYQEDDFIKAPIIVERGYFGSAVGLSANGKILAVGSGGANKVYIYDAEQSGGWQLRYSVTEPSLVPLGSGQDEFGMSLSLSKDGHKIVIGNHFDDSRAKGLNKTDIDMDGLLDSGAAYLFNLGTTSYSLTAFAKATEPGTGDLFAQSVSISGDGKFVAFGAPYEDSNATTINGDTTNNLGTDRGAAYVYPF